MPRYKKNQEYKKFKLRVNAQGRIVIPAPMRQALDIRPGSVLYGEIKGNRVVLSAQEDQMDRAAKELREMSKGAPFSSAKLIARRREEAAEEYKKHKKRVAEFRAKRLRG